MLTSRNKFCERLKARVATWNILCRAEAVSRALLFILMSRLVQVKGLTARFEKS